MKKCLLCKNKFTTKVEIDGVTRNLQNRKYCLSCSPWGEHNTKKLGDEISDIRQCKICGKKFKSTRRWKCGSCNTKIRRMKNKIRAVILLGGKCNRCGWKGNVVAYEFHHKDGEQKEFNLGVVFNRSWDSIVSEILKCELLCSNCHRIEHSDRDNLLLWNEIDIPDLEIYMP